MVNLQDYHLPCELEQEIGRNYYRERAHVSLNNVTPADAYDGEILTARQPLKEQMLRRWVCYI